MKIMDELLEVADTLMGPGGCPWDRKQTFYTLQTYFIEETHEVLEAIDNKNTDKIKEELGDLFYAIIFVSKIAEKQGAFTVEDVIETIREKLIRRHPHVFGDVKIENLDDLYVQWEKIKKQEKGNETRKSALDGIPKSLPVLAKAQKMIHKMLKNKNFDLSHRGSENLSSEERYANQFFDLMVEAVKKDIDIESVLRRELMKREKKFREVEEKAGENL